MLFDDKLMCPGHGAAYSIVSGKPEHAPGLDGIPTFEIQEKDGKVFV